MNCDINFKKNCKLPTEVFVKTPAKINLFFEITGLFADGYHSVETIMQSISLHDSIHIKKNATSEILIESSVATIPTGKSNLAHKASLEFFAYTGISIHGLEIFINKKIPEKAGLAGGSTNAAGVIVGLDYIFGTGLKSNQMVEIAKKIGADVPFCLCGGTIFANGIGDELVSISDISRLKNYLVIVKPSANISTPEAFLQYDKFVKHNKIEKINIEKIFSAISSGDLDQIANNLHNSFEYIADSSQLKSIKLAFKAAGALGSVLSGSGSSVVGFFSDRSKADLCFNEMKKTYSEVFLESFVDHGSKIIKL